MTEPVKLPIEETTTAADITEAVVVDEVNETKPEPARRVAVPQGALQRLVKAEEAYMKARKDFADKVQKYQEEVDEEQKVLNQLQADFNGQIKGVAIALDIDPERFGGFDSGHMLELSHERMAELKAQQETRAELEEQGA